MFDTYWKKKLSLNKAPYFMVAHKIMTSQKDGRSSMRQASCKVRAGVSRASGQKYPCNMYGQAVD